MLRPSTTPATGAIPSASAHEQIQIPIPLPVPNLRATEDAAETPGCVRAPARVLVLRAASRSVSRRSLAEAERASALRVYVRRD